MKKTLNERTITLKLQRIDICNLLIATTAAAQSSGAAKWRDLHDKLRGILDDWDNEHLDTILKELAE